MNATCPAIRLPRDQRTAQPQARCDTISASREGRLVAVPNAMTQRIIGQVETPGLASEASIARRCAGRHRTPRGNPRRQPDTPGAAFEPVSRPPRPAPGSATREPRPDDQKDLSA